MSKILFLVYPKSSIDAGDASRLGYKILQQIYGGNIVEVKLGDNKIHGIDVRDIIIDELAQEDCEEPLCEHGNTMLRDCLACDEIGKP